MKNRCDASYINCTFVKIVILTVLNLLNNFQLIMEVDLLGPKWLKYVLNLNNNLGLNDPDHLVHLQINLSSDLSDQIHLVHLTDYRYLTHLTDVRCQILTLILTIGHQEYLKTVRLQKQNETTGTNLVGFLCELILINSLFIWIKNAFII